MGTPRITVGIDGSSHADAALDWAMIDAARKGAALEVVRAWSYATAIAPEGFMVPAVIGDPEADAKEALEHSVEDALARTNVRPKPVRTMTAKGDPAQVLTDAARDSDRLVVGFRGHGAMGRVLLGSVSTRCVEMASVPVTVVPSHATGLGPIVVGLDGSASSFAALRFAVEEARCTNAALRLVHAFDPPSHFELGVSDLEVYAGELLERMVASVVSEADQASMTIDFVATTGHPGNVLEEEALSASQLIVGFSGDGVLHRFLGSVSRRCVHRAICPTTVIKAPEDEAGSE